MGSAQSPGSCSCRGQPIKVADLTGDGRPDLLIGAPLDANLRGSVYLVPGPFAAGVVDLATAPHLRIVGTVTDGRLGWTVATGRLDGDAQTDVVLAAPWAEAAGRSNAGLLYGLRGPLPATGEVTLGLDSAPLLVRGGTIGDGNAGATVALADTDGDGFDDLHIGLPDSAPLGRRSVGVAYILHGPLLTTLATPTPPATVTPTATDTATASPTATPSATPGRSDTPTDLPPPSDTVPPSDTEPPTSTPTRSASATRPPVPSRTPTRPRATPLPGHGAYLPFASKKR